MAGCIECGVETLYSEDAPGGIIPELQVLNPFI